MALEGKCSIFNLFLFLYFIREWIVFVRLETLYTNFQKAEWLSLRREVML